MTGRCRGILVWVPRRRAATQGRPYWCLASRGGNVSHIVRRVRRLFRQNHQELTFFFLVIVICFFVAGVIHWVSRSEKRTIDNRNAREIEIAK